MAGTLTYLSKLANEEFTRRGVRLFEVPVRQLFDFNSAGTLVVHPDADENRELLAQMALTATFCRYSTSGVSLKRSLQLGSDGKSSLLYAPGCKLLCAVAVQDSLSFKLIGMALVMPLKPAVLEDKVVKILGNHMPTKALYLELVCAEPKTGAATYLLLRLLSKLERTNTGILAHTVNKKSNELFARNAYEKLGSGVWYMSRERATRNAESLESLLRSSRLTRSLCTRRGSTSRTSHRTYWDCK